MEHISMAEIGQFGNIFQPIIKTARFVRMEDGEPFFDETIKPPVLTFKGTIKLHGTCASVCYDGTDLWAQSKNRIITPIDDNAGFAQFVGVNNEYFLNLMKSLYVGEPIALFGEWAGKGIQAGVAISEIEKSFFIFGLKVSGYGWMPLDFDIEEHKNIFKIIDFKTYELQVDFDNPKLSQNKIIEMVNEVENECPVAKHFGISGIGEGIVFETTYKGNRFIFKAKGEKHAGKSKVKKLQKVDNAKLQLINDVVEKVLPVWRLEQMFNETFDIINGGVPDIKGTGDFLKNVSKDVVKEELDVLEENGLTMKDIGSTLSKVAKNWFMEKLEF
jgi:hypothetical protein